MRVIAVSSADAGLVVRCKGDDAAAFNEIVRRYKDRIHNYVQRMTPAGEDAEDLTQEVFVRAFLSIKSFQSRATLSTWLFRIATNVCIDHNRRQTRRRLVPLSAEGDGESPHEQIPDPRYDPQRVYLNRELGDRLQEALDALCDHHRAVVLLHDVEGLPYEEIAGIIDCPLGTVKSRLFNARMQLRKTLGPYLQGVY